MADVAPGAFLVQPAVHDDGPLYIAYQWGPYGPYPEGFAFARGVDPVDPNDPMTWDYLYDPSDLPLRIGLYTAKLYDSSHDYLPLPDDHQQIQMFPQLAPDPLDPNVLYAVFHDLVEPASGQPDEDADVFLVKLTRDPQTDTWTAAQRVHVNDPDDPNAPTPTDQFLPALTVTPGATPAETRVHVIFYDDRKFPNQLDDPQPIYPNFDVFYAYSMDAGETFQWPDEELYQVPPETAVRFELGIGPEFELADYIGIAPQEHLLGVDLWTSFMGTHAGDPGHKSVIYSSRIRWGLP